MVRVAAGGIPGEEGAAEDSPYCSRISCSKSWMTLSPESLVLPLTMARLSCSSSADFSAHCERSRKLSGGSPLESEDEAAWRDGPLGLLLACCLRRGGMCTDIPYKRL